MDYIDFLTRLFKKTGGKYFHLILDTIASKVKMSDGTTVEDTLVATRAQANIGVSTANAAQITANAANNAALTAQEMANSKLDKVGAAQELAGNGLYANGNKLNVSNSVFDSLEELENKLNSSVGYNDEILITESGDFEIPYDGIYEVTVINGGNAARISSTNHIWAGEGQASKTVIKEYTNGQIIPVTIGAGGMAQVVDSSTSSYTYEGGATQFGDITSSANEYVLQGSSNELYNTTGVNVICEAYGGGIGGGYASRTNANGFNFGAGGGGYYNINSTPKYNLGNGYQGCVKLRFFNPEKNISITINDAELITQT